MSERIARPAEQAGRVVVKHPSRWFAAGTEIVTGPNEAAALVRDGRAVAVIPPGKTRVLDVARAPFLQALADPSGGTFAADIYFVTTSPLRGVRFGAKKTVLDPKAHQAVPVVLTGEVTVRVSEAGTFAKQVAENAALEDDPFPAIAKTLADALPDAVEKALAEKIASVLELAGGAALMEAITARLKSAVAERRAGVEVVSLDRLDANVDERAGAALRAKLGGAAKACPGCRLPIGANWAKFCPECGATLPS